jgi:carboxypeptidase Q
MPRRFMAALLLAGSVPLSGAERALPAGVRETATALREKAFSGTRAAEWAQSLADEVGPRAAGSDGDRRAVAWGLAKMKALGLSNVRAERVRVTVWTRGVETGEVLSPYPQKLALTALGGSVATPPAGIEGEVFEVASLEDLEARGAAARGKIVFFDKKMERRADGAGYGRTVDVRGKGASAAAKNGAIAVVIRSIGTDHDRLPHTGGMTYETDAPKIPAAALAIPDAEILERMLRGGTRVRIRMTLGCHDSPPADSANVIGEIPGLTKPKEIVLLGAHLDSWDLGTGGNDDGAGCGIVLEAARLIIGLSRRPARTIRVVLYANEEHGIEGGKAYREAHVAELPLHAASFESDNGSGRPFALQWLAGPSALPAVREIAEILEPLGAGSVLEGGAGGADISPLRADGVPQFALRQDASLYFDWHHTANDTADKIDRAGMDANAAAAAAFAWAAASVDPMFEKIPADKRLDEAAKK